MKQIRLPLKERHVTGFPNDPQHAPAEIRLNKRLNAQSNKALARAKKSGNEWGFFLHFDKKGRILPGELRAGTLGIWITQEEYSSAKTEDETIHGLVHTHLDDSVFSPENIGFFLFANDVVSICVSLQEDFSIMLRTKQTDPPREGIFREATTDYARIALSQANADYLEYLETRTDGDETLYWKEAKREGIAVAMKEICKRYNIALYIGKMNKAAKKVV